MILDSYVLGSGLDPLPRHTSVDAGQVDLVLVFGLREILQKRGFLERICAGYPNAQIIGCSSVGEILNAELHEYSAVVAPIQFQQPGSRAEVRSWSTTAEDDHRDLGREIAHGLIDRDMRGLLVFAEGTTVDGDELVGGIREGLNQTIPVFGGLAADLWEFHETVVLSRQGADSMGVVACGLYGPSLEVSVASSEVVPPRLGRVEITSSHGNLIHEIDHKPALDGLLAAVGVSESTYHAQMTRFPFLLQGGKSSGRVQRTPSCVDLETREIYTAGTLPEGPTLILDYQDPKWITDDARSVIQGITSEGDPEIILVVDCAGRRATLGTMSQQAIDSMTRGNVGKVPLFGFYGYGEIGIPPGSTEPLLLNQTLTALSLREVPSPSI